MSGPRPMALGGFAFQAMGFGYEDVGRQLKTPWAQLQVAGGFDVQQWTGPESEDITISGVLFPEEFGGQSSLDGIRAAAMAGRALMLVSRDGSIHGRYVVHAVDEDRGYHDRRGRPRMNRYKISLRRHRGAAGSFASAFAAIF